MSGKACEGEPRTSNEPDRDPLQILKLRPRPSYPEGRPAVFLDRDGTVIEHIHFLSDAAKVRLLPGASAAIQRLREAGYACVIVSNQSGVGRGLISLKQLNEIHLEMARQLAEAGTEVDAIYYCPESPTGDDPLTIEHIDRKPGPGMLYRAAEALGLDLDASWMVGDTLVDVRAGEYAGCLGNVLVRTGKAFQDGDFGDSPGFLILDSLKEVADQILKLAPPSF